eukprot:371551-Amphidinium_carterae.2
MFGGCSLYVLLSSSEVVINNGVHDSVGGQPTFLRNVHAIAKALGYKKALQVPPRTGRSGPNSPTPIFWKSS